MSRTRPSTGETIQLITVLIRSALALAGISISASQLIYLKEELAQIIKDAEKFSRDAYQQSFKDGHRKQAKS